MLEVEKSFRFFRSRKRIPEADIVKSIDKDKFFALPNEDELNMAMFRYVRTHAHIFTQRALQQFKATKKKKKTNATRNFLKIKLIKIQNIQCYQFLCFQFRGFISQGFFCY